MERLRLSPEPTSPRLARDFLRGILRDRGIAPTIIEDAALLTTEVVTNAVIHARTDITLEVEMAEDLWISVSDSSHSPLALHYPDETETTGRGVFLLDRLSSQWEVLSDEGGKTVRFKLPASQMVDR